ncbi:MAG: metallophosphoesterase [Kiritimatiellae bacterium]|nr:metallophosphoesterase [Kiritimatiellia bacterium]
MFEEEISRLASRVGELSKTCPFGFWFISDLHVPSNHCRSGELLAELIAETGLRTVVCGGDIPDAFGSRFEIDEAVERYRRLWVAAVEAAGGDFLPLHGNHDFTVRAAPDVEDGFTYGAVKTAAILLDTKAVRRLAHTMSGAPGSCAYFVDFPSAGVRLVALDTHEGVIPGRSWWGRADEVSVAQLRWLSKEVLGTLPAGWLAVVASHAPIAGVAANDGEKKTFLPLRKALAPLSATGRVALAISGHHHGELQSCVDGLWHVSEPCDAAYVDYINRSLPWIPGLPEKDAGTWAGQTFDAVQFDFKRGLVHFTRVGGGSNRTLRLAVTRLQAGDTMALRAETLHDSGMWGCYDADHTTQYMPPNAISKFDHAFKYHNDVATISNDGVISALSPGEAVAVARAPDGSREYLPIAVVADCRSREGILVSAIGALAFACFIVAAVIYPGGGYNPFCQMLSALGEIEVKGVLYPVCHYWFMAGMFLSATSVGLVWASLARRSRGWRRTGIAIGGVVNFAGLCTIALVPFDVNGAVHNLGCYFAVGGGTVIVAATFRHRCSEIAWAAWFAVVVALFAVFLNVDAIPFSPFVTATQKVLIISFAAWAGWLAWKQ